MIIMVDAGTITPNAISSVRVHAPPLLPIDIIHATYATSATDEFCETMRSASSHGFLRTVVLGMNRGVEFKSHGLLDKVYALHEFVEHVITLHPDSHILFTDGYDVAFNGHISDTARGYAAAVSSHNTSTNVLFSGEMGCCGTVNAVAMLRSSCDSNFPPADGAFRWLNSGAFIGQVDHVLRLLRMAVRRISAVHASRDMPVFKHGTDQLLFCDMYADGVGNIRIDSNASLFISLYKQSWRVGALDDGVVITPPVQGSRPPSIIHFNGNAEKALFMRTSAAMRGGVDVTSQIRAVPWPNSMHPVECRH